MNTAVKTVVVSNPLVPGSSPGWVAILNTSTLYESYGRPAEIEYKECGEVNSETYWENGVEYKP